MKLDKVVKPVIFATWEAEGGRIAVQRQQGKKFVRPHLNH
jgi:hypothetical protein